MKSQLVVRGVLPGEIAHHYDPKRDEKLFSRANRFFGVCGGRSFEVSLPLSFTEKLKTASRLTRRLTRSDKSTAVFNHARDGLCILYSGRICFYDLARGTLARVGTLQQCRNILHGGMAVTPHGIYFGEYGANPERIAVPLWASRDDGRSWSIVHEFPEKSIKHVHGVYADPYSDSLWIPTGDFEDECFVYEAPGGDFSRMIRHGDGRQEWRPVSMFFERDRIVWAMDSQLQTSYLQVFDRADGSLSQGMGFPGPVWYSKHFNDGTAVLQSTVEIGPGSQSDHAHVFASGNLIDWREIARYRKDFLPKRYFKFGVIAFADGEQSPDDFVIFGEALNGIDGRILRVSLS